MFLITSLVSKSRSIWALSKSIVNPVVSTSVIKPLSFLTKKNGSFTVTVDIFAKKFLGSDDKKIYFPFILSPAFLNVISTPIFLSIGSRLSVYNDSKEILYIVRSSIYPFETFWINSFGKSITKFPSQSRKFNSFDFLIRFWDNDFWEVEKE